MPFHFLTRKYATSSSEDAPPPYDPALINVLEADHTTLMVLLQQARQAAKTARYVDVSASLMRFELAYRIHLGRKEQLLMPYLEHHLQAEEGKTRLRNLAGSGNLTQRSVEVFLRHYEAYPVSERNLHRFGRELDQLIAELGYRLATETGFLHVLYRPV